MINRRSLLLFGGQLLASIATQKTRLLACIAAPKDLVSDAGARIPDCLSEGLGGNGFGLHLFFYANASWFAHQRITSQPGAVGARKVKPT